MEGLQKCEFESCSTECGSADFEWFGVAIEERKEGFFLVRVDFGIDFFVEKEGSRSVVF